MTDGSSEGRNEDWPVDFSSGGHWRLCKEKFQWSAEGASMVGECLRDKGRGRIEDKSKFSFHLKGF